MLKAAVTTERCRVAHVSLGHNVGGMEKLLVEFARHADRGRFQLDFISLQSRGKLAPEIEAGGWNTHALEKRPGLRPGIIWKLAWLLRGLQADVVHTHNTVAFFYGLPAARLARVRRVIHTRHGQRGGAPNRQTVAFRWLSRFADKMVSVSEDATQLSIAEGIAAEKACTILNGIDLARFTYTGPQSNGPALLVARLSPEKDVITLLKAARVVADERPDFRLEIAGDGPCRSDLTRLAADLGLSRHVCFHGETHDVAALLARASLFVLPSLQEGISLTLLEAMARGLPVVATRVGGNPEVVEEGVTGLLVPPQNPTSLAVAVVRLASDPARAQEMGQAGRQRVESLFDVRRMVRQYEACYLGGQSGSVSCSRFETS
ncbi:MAG: glycosyltransferase [Thermoguttaceae bacterium]|jgi:sugar transferase (PEP-CTERM/EpsH1 system associated)